MPIYEYICNTCNSRFSVLVKVVTTTEVPACPVCRKTDLRKLMSRFAITRSEEAIIDDLADTTDMEQLTHEIKSELGEEFSDDIDEILESSEEALT